ncbi:MAG: serine hydrolase domain-containing protein [Rhodothermales bacterium]
MFRSLLFRCAFGLFLTFVFTSSQALGQALERIKPEQVGMSSERLNRMTDVLDEYVNSDLIPGSVTLVLKDGYVVHERAVGMRDRETQDHMETTDLFRIASMTKAVISTAVLILQEQGKLNIQEPVGKYLPEWLETTVAIESENGYEVVPSNRRITIRDLLTHTAGVGWGQGLAADEWEAADLRFWYLADRPEGIREFARSVAALPMDDHPGERFVYGVNQDILGAVIEEASGQRLDVFLQEQLLEPLGMVDTHFFVPPDKTERLTVVYGSTSEGLVRQTHEDGHYHGQGHYVEGPRATFGGGAGLVSTARDYARFLQMWINGGELDGARILSPTTVTLALSDHTAGRYTQPGRALGLAFGVVTDLGAYGMVGSEGEFGWGGAYHTSYFASPKHNMVVVYLTQTMISRPGVDDFAKLTALAYQAIIE